MGSSAVHGARSSAAKDASEVADNDSRSASDHPGGGGEDDADAGNTRKRKKRYHRHTPHQIQQLEA
jgi:homeobox-leucine zipper protein